MMNPCFMKVVNGLTVVKNIKVNVIPLYFLYNKTVSIKQFQIYRKKFQILKFYNGE